jgi:hypothetical protein
MAKKKPSPALEAKRKVGPPADDPQRREHEDIELDSRAMAEKRLEALKKLRKKPPEPPEKTKH